MAPIVQIQITPTGLSLFFLKFKTKPITFTVELLPLVLVFGLAFVGVF